MRKNQGVNGIIFDATYLLVLSILLYIYIYIYIDFSILHNLIMFENLLLTYFVFKMAYNKDLNNQKR